MTGARVTGRVTATAAARQAIAGLRARNGPVMFIQAAGRGGRAAPMCYRRGEFLLGQGDVLLGDVEGCPYYTDGRLDAAWGQPQLLLDVEPGFAAGRSLPAGPGKQFVARAPVRPRRGAPHRRSR